MSKQPGKCCKKYKDGKRCKDCPKSPKATVTSVTASRGLHP
ncbi:hypothetical protein [Lamprocystis purpurea]|nr:hypothetical protein [Lamprocystis purpurea]